MLLLLEVFAVLAVVFGVAVVLTGRSEGLSDEGRDYADVGIPRDRAMTAADVVGLRFALAFRGYRMVEILKQGQYKPLNVVDQIMIIYAGNAGALDKVDRRKVKDWEEQFLLFMKEQKPEVRALLAKEKKMTDEVIAALNAAIADFQPQFKG